MDKAMLLLEQLKAINNLLAAEIKFNDFRDVNPVANETTEEIQTYTDLCNQATQAIYSQAGEVWEQ